MQHQQGSQCSHCHGGHGQGGHSHGPAHGHGHGHGHGPMGGHNPDESPDEYFKNLKKKWGNEEERVFFWQEVLHGVALDRLYEKYGLDFMRSLTCQMPQMVIFSIQNMLNFDWIPSRLKPITAGTQLSTQVCFSH